MQVPHAKISSRSATEVARPARPRARRPLLGPAAFFVLPAALTMLAVIVVPLMFSLWFSFSGWVLPRPASRDVMVGLRNYGRILSDGDFWRAVGVTAQFTVVGVLLQCVLGLGLALLFNRPFPGRGLFRSLMLLPMVATPAVIAIFWKLLYQEGDGIYNWFLGQVSLGPIPWLSADWALFSIILMDTWQAAPFFMLILLSGLQTIDESTLAAARMDGANAFQITRYITLPHLVPYVMIAAAFRSIATLSEFDKMYLLTLGGPGSATTSMSLYAYNAGFKVFDMGQTAAASWIIMALTLVVTMPLIVYLFRGAAANRD